MNATTKRLLLLSWIAALLILSVILWQPILFTSLKIAILLLGVWILVVPVILWRRSRPIFAVLAGLVLVVALWPRSEPPAALMRENYVAALHGALGTRYVWGGENSRGLDCSGLLRFAMIRALAQSGWQTRNPDLWREAAFVWWRDCSANEMRLGYSGRISRLFEADSLNELDDSRLELGDLAVTSSGAHVLAFVGNRGWIQADPNLANGGDKVVLTQAPTRNGWFGQGVQICRWKILETDLAQKSN